MKNIIVSILIIILVSIGFYFIAKIFKNNEEGINFPKTEQKQENRFWQEQGVEIEVLREGSGQEAKEGSKLTVNYIGTLEDGQEFDSSFRTNTPFSFTLGEGRVIKGWEIGTKGMKKGERRKLTIPSDLGYGQTGVPGLIPPNSILIFEVELLGIE